MKGVRHFERNANRCSGVSRKVVHRDSTKFDPPVVLVGRPVLETESKDCAKCL